MVEFVTEFVTVKQWSSWHIPRPHETQTLGVPHLPLALDLNTLAIALALTYGVGVRMVCGVWCMGCMRVCMCMWCVCWMRASKSHASVSCSWSNYSFFGYACKCASADVLCVACSVYTCLCVYVMCLLTALALMRGVWCVCVFVCVFDLYVNEFALMCDTWWTCGFICVCAVYVN